MKKVIEPFDFNAKNFKWIEVKGFKSPQLSYWPDFQRNIFNGNRNIATLDDAITVDEFF